VDDKARRIAGAAPKKIEDERSPKIFLKGANGVVKQLQIPLSPPNKKTTDPKGLVVFLY